MSQLVFGIHFINTSQINVEPIILLSKPILGISQKDIKLILNVRVTSFLKSINVILNQLKNVLHLYFMSLTSNGVHRRIRVITYFVDIMRVPSHTDNLPISLLRSSLYLYKTMNNMNQINLCPKYDMSYFTLVPILSVRVNLKLLNQLSYSRHIVNVCKITKYNQINVRVKKNFKQDDTIRPPTSP